MIAELANVPLEPIAAAACAYVRLTGLFLTLPGVSSAPTFARVLLALPLCIVLMPAVPQQSLPPTVLLLAVTLVGEMLIGAAIGLGVRICFGALPMALETVSVKIGLELGAVMDPLTMASHGALPRLGSWLATGVFFSANIHLMCIRAMGASLEALPPGALTVPGGGAMVLMDLFTSLWSASLGLAGPLLAFSLAVNLGMGIITRMSPSLQMFFSVGMSLTILIGLWLVDSALATMIPQQLLLMDELSGWLQPLWSGMHG